ncbi:MAG: GFA family protein [Burkholderiaceae bacterium]
MKGQCLCGQVRFELTGGIPGLYQCHCSLCRKQGGSASNSATLVSLEGFQWLSNTDAVQQWQKPTGFSSHFCKSCGSPVPNLLGESGYVWVPAGLFEQERDLQIVAHLFVGSRASWDTEPLRGECYQEMPSLSELVSVLRAPPESQ